MPKLDQYIYDAIVGYMDDDIRERVHNYMAPCNNEEFLIEYCAQDRSFEELIERKNFDESTISSGGKYNE